MNWEDIQGVGWYPLKIFEYLSSQRPILATGGLGDDLIQELLEYTKAGNYVKTIEDMKNCIIKSYISYKHGGKMIYNGDLFKINEYSYKATSKKYAEILDDLI